MYIMMFLRETILPAISLVAFVGVVVSLARPLPKLVDKATEDLLTLFHKDLEKWWWEKELPKAIGKSGFLTRAALNLLNEEGRLRRKSVSISGIRIYSLHPRVSKERHLKGKLVQLDSLT